MSLLTDREYVVIPEDEIITDVVCSYLLHSLRFNYLRTVLPNHSPLNPNALISCAPSPSAYLQWFDSSQYPELLSVSPPLELSLQTRTRNNLNYSSTIAPSKVTTTTGGTARGSLETSLLRGRLASIVIPVIVHSPAKSNLPSPLLRTPDVPPSPFADGADDDALQSRDEQESSYPLPHSLAPTSSVGSSVVGIDLNDSTRDLNDNDGERRRSDSVASSDIQSYASKDPVQVVRSLPKVVEKEEVPLAMARRERRRVNISGRILLPIVEPEGEVVDKRASTDSSRRGLLTLPPTTTRSQNFLTFPRRQIPLLSSTTAEPDKPPTKSALSTLLSSFSSTSTSSNPFSTLYAALSSKGTDSLKLSLYFPHSKEPTRKLVVNVKRDLSVEEVIGVGLLGYWEEEREPKLELGDGGGEDEEEMRARETAAWNLRIVEDDGEVDEDFPGSFLSLFSGLSYTDMRGMIALDRSRAVSAFSFGEFAIVHATPSQIRDNLIKQSKIQRRPSRILAAPSQRLVPISNNIPNPTTDGLVEEERKDRVGEFVKESGGMEERTTAEREVSTYHIYTVLRKLALPLGMGRHTRTLLLDGDYLFIASSNSGAAPAQQNLLSGGGEPGRTKSFHASLILEAGLSRRGGRGSFKVVVRSGGRKDGAGGGRREVKRYDFEAEDRKLARSFFAPSLSSLLTHSDT